MEDLKNAIRLIKSKLKLFSLIWKSDVLVITNNNNGTFTVEFKISEIR